MSHDLVKDFTVKTVENNCTVASTSLSRASKIWPKIDLSSAACSHRITPITIANCNRGNLTMLRIGAKSSLIIRWVLPAVGSTELGENRHIDAIGGVDALFFCHHELNNGRHQPIVP